MRILQTDEGKRVKESWEAVLENAERQTQARSGRALETALGNSSSPPLASFTSTGSVTLG